jgi:hypothetical protein
MVAGDGVLVWKSGDKAGIYAITNSNCCTITENTYL